MTWNQNDYQTEPLETDAFFQEDRELNVNLI